MEEYLSKVDHLAVIGEISQHVHARKTHPVHSSITSWKARIPISIWTALLLLIGLLLLLSVLLLLTLLAKGSYVIWAELGWDARTIPLSINGQRGRSVQGVVAKDCGRWRIIKRGRLCDAGLGTVAVVSESVTVVVGRIGLTSECGRPTGFFRIWTTNSFNGPLESSEYRVYELKKGTDLHHVDFERVRILGSESRLRVVHYARKGEAKEDEGKGEIRTKAVRIVRSVVESRETNVWIGQKKTRTKKKKRKRNSNDA